MTLLLFLAIFMAVQNPVAANGPRPVISVNLDSTSKNVKLGDEIQLKIVVTNVSDHEVRLTRSSGKGQGEFFNRFKVFDGQGNEPARTKYYRSLWGERGDTEPQEEINIEIVGSLTKPGDSVTEQVDLNKLYKIEKPGIYKIQVEHEDPETKTLIKSNVVTVTVS